MSNAELNITEISTDEARYRDVMSTWRMDIEQIFPHFEDEEANDSSIYLLQKEGEPIGVFIAQKKGEELHVHVDYVIPAYRGLGIGKNFFHQKLQQFKSQGLKLVVSLTDNLIHKTYLLDLGFTASTIHEDRLELDIQP